MDASIRAHGQGRAQDLLALGRTHGDGDDLGGSAGLLESDGLLDRDLVERVDAHLDVGDVDARLVRLDSNLDGIIDRTLDSHQDARHDVEGGVGRGGWVVRVCAGGRACE